MKPLSLLFPVFAAAAPTPPTPPTPPAPSAPSTDTTSTWNFKSGAGVIEIQTTGNVTFDPASDALYDLHGDGTLHVTERTGKEQRELTAKGGNAEWKVNGSIRPFDATGKLWLRTILKAGPATPTPPTPPHH